MALTSSLSIGDRVKFNRGDNTVQEDVIRGFFTYHQCLEPMARNRSFPAVTLTNHSWCAMSDVIEVLPPIRKGPRKIRAIPDYDTLESTVPAFRKVFYADHLGRIMRSGCDVFATRDQACVYWWMLARKGVLAFIDAGLDGQYSNSHLTRDKEPADLVASIDFAEHHYDAEDSIEASDEGAMFFRANSIFSAGRRG